LEKRTDFRADFSRFRRIRCGCGVAREAKGGGDAETENLEWCELHVDDRFTVVRTMLKGTDAPWQLEP
jgi:hypothetical protein